jgi:predicted solute-binding protein
MRVSAWPALSRIRIGCVRYLNARPLIHCYEGPVVCEHPAALADAIARNEIDAGLVPIVELFGSRRYLVVDEVAIASDGPVRSVILAHKKPLPQISRIVADPASRTSVLLLRVLRAEFHGLDTELVEHDPDPDAARLLIGNQALAFRSRAPEFTFFDLGEEWSRRTALPFVYAAWLLRPEIADAVPSVSNAFRKLKRDGLAALSAILAAGEKEPEESAIPRAIRQQYLQQNIHFDLGPREKEGMFRFRELLRKHALIDPEAGHPIEFV